MGQNDLVKTLRMNYLFDFYQSLLTNKQRNYLELFYLEDYSLSEIADTFNVSRQAVYDNIRRTGDLVEDYEKKLELYQKFEQRREIYDEMKQHLSNPEQIQRYIQQLEDLESDIN
ncbi:putative DNA-binding protein [Staphylococcus aureus]|nr:putative DNA-binding protein [Staphylococcus aureus]